MDFNSELPINKRLIDFNLDTDDYSPYVQTFKFIISDKSEVPLLISNNIIQHTVTVYVNTYY